LPTDYDELLGGGGFVFLYSICQQTTTP